jgi:Flp pilus assembly protein TadG
MLGRTCSDRGGVLLEFSLIASTMLFLLGIITDLGIGLWRYTILASGTAQQVRSVAAALSQESSASCASISAAVTAVLNESFMQDTYGLAGTYQFQATVAPKTQLNAVAALSPRLQVTAKMVIDYGFFSRQFHGLVLSTRTETAIDNINFDNKCCGAGCDCKVKDCS